MTIEVLNPRWGGGGSGGAALASWADLPPAEPRAVVARDPSRPRTYARGSIADYAGRVVLMRETVTVPPGTGTAVLPASSYVALGPGGMLDAAARGLAAGDPQAAAANQAVRAGVLADAALAGLPVDLGAGEYWVGPGQGGAPAVEVPAGVVLCGRGPAATRLRLAGGAGVPLVQLRAWSDAGLRDVRLDGARASQPSPQPGVRVAAAVGARAGMARIAGVQVMEASGDGVQLEGRGGVVLEQVEVTGCGWAGYAIGPGVHLSGCRADSNANSGFRVTGGGAVLSGCVATGNGVTADGSYAGTGQIHGYEVVHGAAGGVVTLTGCVAARNAGAGMYVHGSGSVVNVTGLTCDTNNASINGWPAIVLDAVTGSTVTATSVQHDQAGLALPGQQEHALQLAGGATRNTITLTHYAVPGGQVPAGDPLDPRSTPAAGNTIVANGRFIAGVESGAGPLPGWAAFLVAPPPARWLTPQGVAGAGEAELEPGILKVLPVVLPFGGPIDAIGANVTRAAAGGQVRAWLGLWHSSPEVSYPSFSAPVATGEIDVTATGVKQVPVGSMLQAGVYWVGVLYTETEAPTTRPRMSAANAVTGLWTSTAGQCAKGLRVTGTLTGLPSADQTMQHVTGANPPIVSLLRAP